MKANSAIGIGVGIGCLLLSMLMEGGNPAALISIPALIVVVGGTFAATFASTTVAQMKLVPALYRKAFQGNDVDERGTIDLMVSLAEQARREGLLALEKQLDRVEDPFLRNGVQLVVDGTDSELVRAILLSEIDGMAERHRGNVRVFATAGGFAPTLGIIGTVLGLVHVLENLSTPSLLGHSIAGAFIATLYGVGSANLVFLPVGNKLKELSGAELAYRDMQLEAVLSIQAGDNPRLLREKLEAFLEPARRGTDRRDPGREAVPRLREAQEAEAA